jgi:epoxide hydrolase-like predicted phosphatase
MMEIFDQKPKVIVFDIGGVLLDWKTAVPKISNLLNISEEKMFEELWSHNVDMDLGKFHQDDFWKYLSEKYNPSVEAAFLKKTWIEEQPPIENGWRILEEAKKAGFMIVCLTNNWKDTLERQMEIHENFSLFDRIFNSAYLGERKPNKKVYEIIEDKIGYKGPDIFFIDDVKENCEGAEKLGWHTFKFDHTKNEGQEDYKTIKDLLGIN